MSSNLKLQWLADELIAAGLTVEQPPGWETNTSPTNNGYDPVGLINHHTVGTGYTFPYSFLADKCNLLVRLNGHVATMNAGYAYDSGNGAAQVLTKVAGDEPLEWDDIKDLKSTILGNPYFVDIEVEHKGDGSPIGEAQYDALIRCNVVICDHFGWDPLTRVIGHYEWAPDRKIDPYWNGAKYATMPTIRTDTANAQGALMGYAIPTDDTAPESEIRFMQHLLGVTVDGVWGPATATAKVAAVGGAEYGNTPADAVKLHQLMAPKVHGNNRHDPVFTQHTTFLTHIGNDDTAHGHPHDTGGGWDEPRVAALESDVAALASHTHDEGVTGPPQ